jgi:hypothetical protein
VARQYLSRFSTVGPEVVITIVIPIAEACTLHYFLTGSSDKLTGVIRYTHHLLLLPCGDEQDRWTYILVMNGLNVLIVVEEDAFPPVTDVSV